MLKDGWGQVEKTLCLFILNSTKETWFLAIHSFVVLVRHFLYSIFLILFWICNWNTLKIMFMMTEVELFGEISVSMCFVQIVCKYFLAFECIV